MCYIGNGQVPTIKHLSREPRHSPAGAPLIIDMMDYQSKQWDAMRRHILHRDKYQCQLCRRYGKIRSGNHVHHIFPAEHYDEYQYKTWNLITLCQSCHNRMHDRDTHELSTAGQNLLRRTARAHGISYGIPNTTRMV